MKKAEYLRLTKDFKHEGFTLTAHRIYFDITCLETSKKVSIAYEELADFVYFIDKYLFILTSGKAFVIYELENKMVKYMPPSLELLSEESNFQEIECDNYIFRKYLNTLYYVPFLELYDRYFAGYFQDSLLLFPNKKRITFQWDIFEVSDITGITFTNHLLVIKIRSEYFLFLPLLMYMEGRIVDILNGCIVKQSDAWCVKIKEAAVAIQLLSTMQSDYYSFDYDLEGVTVKKGTEEILSFPYDKIYTIAYRTDGLYCITLKNRHDYLFGVTQDIYRINNNLYGFLRAKTVVTSQEGYRYFIQRIDGRKERDLIGIFLKKYYKRLVKSQIVPPYTICDSAFVLDGKEYKYEDITGYGYNKKGDLIIEVDNRLIIHIRQSKYSVPYEICRIAY